jgi:organic radical activating enzyme
MLINIHKLALIVHLIENADTNDFRKPITFKTLETAILINEFYFTNFKIILEENISITDREATIDEIIKVAIKNKATQKDVVAITGKDKATISRRWNKVLNATQHAT